MKKIALLISLAFIGFSCSDDEESSSGDLVGTWLWTQSFEDGEEYELDECEMMDSLIFTSNEVTSTYYYEEDGQCVIDDSETTSYSVSGNTLTSGDYSVEYSINGSELSITEVDSYDSDGDGVDEDYTYVDIYTKQ